MLISGEKAKRYEANSRHIRSSEAGYRRVLCAISCGGDGVWGAALLHRRRANLSSWAWALRDGKGRGAGAVVPVCTLRCRRWRVVVVRACSEWHLATSFTRRIRRFSGDLSSSGLRGPVFFIDRHTPSHARKLECDHVFLSRIANSFDCSPHTTVPL